MTFKNYFMILYIFGEKKKENQLCRATLTRSELVITTCLVYVCLWTSNPLALLRLQPFIPSPNGLPPQFLSDVSH